MNYSIAALINFLTLLVGIAIGLALSSRTGTVSAQSNQASSCVSSATVECVAPIMTVGSAGIGRLLADQISAGQLTVNGYDVLKLDNNILAAMVQAHAITSAQAQTLAESSHADKQLRFQSSQQSQPPSQK